MALILIVDDDELVVEIVAEALSAAGHVVGTLDDGLHVIDVVHLKRPALVILDCSMPTLSGIEALRQIRMSASCFDTPVLMLTGRRSEADELIAIRAGANSYMRKPFEPGRLVARIDTLLSRAAYRPETIMKKALPAPARATLRQSRDPGRIG
jgi:DNA-binding response OmpR family regulator